MNLLRSFCSMGRLILNTFTILFISHHTRWWTLMLWCLMLWQNLAVEFYCRAESENMPKEITVAHINITWHDSQTGKITYHVRKDGIFGTNGKLADDYGMLVHVRNGNKSDGCTPPSNIPSSGRWIALIERGDCRFHVKINNAAKIANASAVIIYDNVTDHSLHNPTIMEHDVDDVVSVFISRESGLFMTSVMANNTKVTVYITRGKSHPLPPTSINKTSVLFVSISFIVLMIISLAWLVFYYIQRFRYAHAKERLSRRLASAAKKAITKIPLRAVKNGDKETTPDFDPCAVCIEGYKTHDVVRILPCKHVFHKSCVDPWLLEQRSCPMCKMDILKAYGFHVNGSCESVNNRGSNNRVVDVVADTNDVETVVANTQTTLTTDHSSATPTRAMLRDNDIIDNDDSDTHIQVLHLEPPDIECHDTTTRGAVCLLSDQPDDDEETVLESARSSESDYCNEMQSLMSSSDTGNNVAGIHGQQQQTLSKV
ncbi:RING finger protein 150-like [Tubulanus polymorphus]|uniref:RING finger protein 150-like n=1 Tax=Tubulanus polymorphus TaxID=672921 RepID=UPI003DA23C5D